MTIRDLLVSAIVDVPHGQRPVLGASAALDDSCAGVTADSRAVAPGTIFVAVRGQKADGATFVHAAIAAGAAAIVAEHEISGARVPVVVVPDARRALALLAAEYFGHPSRELRVVGVTGTNGKTTTSYILREIFEAAGTRCGLIGTVAYRVGDAAFEATRTTPEAPQVQGLLREMVSAGCGACVMEVSSHALALRRVDGVRFAAGVFTNLTRDHLDFHGDMEGYFGAKRRLFEMLPPGAPAIINADDPRAAALAEASGHPVTFGINKVADVSPGPLSISLQGLAFDVRAPQGTVRVTSRLVGRANVYNILAAAATATALGLPLDAVASGLAKLPGVPGRFEIVSGTEDDITVLVDYAHTDDALRNLLETCRPIAERRLITVFGAGGDRDRTKRPLMGMVAARLSDIVVLTSDNPRSEDPDRIIEEVRRGADAEGRQSHAEILAVPDRREAIAQAIRRAETGDVVIVAGKGHEKYQDVGGRSIPFDDVAVASEALAARRGGVRAG